jgi:hypothetical protein
MTYGRARRAAALLTVAGTLAGCGGGTPAPQATTPDGAGAGTGAPSSTVAPSSRLTVTSYEYSFTASGPVNLAAGKITITLRNGGIEPHNAQVIRLQKGVTDKVVAKAASDDPSGGQLLALGDPVGGPGTVSPGGAQESVQTLTPGSYLMFCLVRAPSGEVHAADGMVDQFSVAANPAGHPDPRPTAELRLTDSGFRLPSSFPRGGVLRVTNQGTQAHEVTFLRLPTGKGVSAAAPYLRRLRSPALLQQPPPFPAAGGVSAISPGQSADLRIQLPPGDYLAICLLPSEDGTPHAIHGMAVHFTVK